MSETKHQPTPWEWDAESGEVRAANGKIVARRLTGCSPEASPNGAFITLACNSHDDLLAACSDLMNAFWDMSPLEYAHSKGMNSMSDAEGERIKDRARAAIAKAKP